MQNNVNNGKSHEKYWRLRQEPKPNGGKRTEKKTCC